MSAVASSVKTLQARPCCHKLSWTDPRCGQEKFPRQNMPFFWWTWSFLELPVNMSNLYVQLNISLHRCRRFFWKRPVPRQISVRPEWSGPFMDSALRCVALQGHSVSFKLWTEEQHKSWKEVVYGLMGFVFDFRKFWNVGRFVGFHHFSLQDIRRFSVNWIIQVLESQMFQFFLNQNWTLSMFVLPRPLLIDSV